MTDEDKIIQLFESGDYQLAYQLKDSLNVDMDYSKISLVKTVRNLSNNNTLYISSKSNLEFEIELVSSEGPGTIDWIDYKEHTPENPKFIESLKHLMYIKFDISCSIEDLMFVNGRSLLIYNCLQVDQDPHSSEIEKIEPKFIKYLFES